MASSRAFRLGRAEDVVIDLTGDVRIALRKLEAVRPDIAAEMSGDQLDEARAALELAHQRLSVVMLELERIGAQLEQRDDAAGGRAR